jgi:Fe-S cluster assembly iron-binding protein IscA
MDITKRAMKQINRIRDHQGVSKAVGLRLGFEEGSVYLRWDSMHHGDEDLVIMKGGFSIVIDAQAYLQLADYVLDYTQNKGFSLLPGPGMTKGKSAWETHVESDIIRRNQS